MRWNCPHCGVNLAVSDDKLGAGWSFSRCYKCGGFALIRRAEVNLVKVDRAPAGEHIILPEATEEPAAMLSEEAMQNLARLRRDSAERAATRAAMNQHAAAIQNHLENNLPQFPPRVLQPIESAGTAAMPAPLPEVPAKLKKGIRPLPIAIGAAGLMTIASGAYLYIQGQALWEKARTPILAEQNETRTYRPVSARANEALPAPAIALRDPRGEASDQIKNSAMAPERAEDPTVQAAAAPIAPAAPAPASLNAPKAEIAAPTIKTAASLLVQPRAKNADLHSGPGSLYPIVGIASPNKQYLVTDWNDRWFRVILKEDAIKTSAPKMAWIRTDLVQVVPAGSDSLPPYP